MPEHPPPRIPTRRLKPSGISLVVMIFLISSAARSLMPIGACFVCVTVPVIAENLVAEMASWNALDATKASDTGSGADIWKELPRQAHSLTWAQARCGKNKVPSDSKFSSEDERPLVQLCASTPSVDRL